MLHDPMLQQRILTARGRLLGKAVLKAKAAANALSSASPSSFLSLSSSSSSSSSSPSIFPTEISVTSCDAKMKDEGGVSVFPLDRALSTCSNDSDTSRLGENIRSSSGGGGGLIRSNSSSSGSEKCSAGTPVRLPFELAQGWLDLVRELKGIKEERIAKETTELLGGVLRDADR